VLLVEDSPADQEILRRAFQQSAPGHDLRSVLDGESAMKYLLRREDFIEGGDAPRPSLILLDLNLPNLSGREVLERVRANPDLRHIPVVILTTTQAPHEIAECYRLGANCFLTKPSSFTEFADLIGRTCDFWLRLATLPPAPSATIAGRPTR
jgi:two-component system response regulator